MTGWFHIETPLRDLFQEIQLTHSVVSGGAIFSFLSPKGKNQLTTFFLKKVLSVREMTGWLVSSPWNPPGGKNHFVTDMRFIMGLREKYWTQLSQGLWSIKEQ